VASYFWLGDHYSADVPARVNGAIATHCNKLRFTTASVAETEYAGLFCAGQHAAGLRATLEEMGYPQPATPIQGDNTCANGIANDMVNQKRSRAMDTRLHWIRDRVRRGEFLIYWRPGAFNMADFFTKNHSAAHCKQVRHLYVTDGTPIVAVSTARSRHKARNIIARTLRIKSQ
jgi:hypothetical protein